MKIKVYLLNSFGINSSGGNPAGVVLNAENLTTSQKKLVAREIGFSETAFIEKSKFTDFKLSFFTPTEEVDICGHATIAAYSLLFQKRLIQKGIYLQELKAGKLPIEVKDNGEIFMDLQKPIFGDTFSAEELTDIFNIGNDVINSTVLKPQVISTGNPNILVPIIDRETLFEIKPDFKKMEIFNKKTNTVGFHLFTFETINKNSIANCRDFFPLYGVEEESATGNANGSLACYLFKHGKIGNRNLSNLIFEQGNSMNKPSQIKASLESKGEDITRIKIGGKASIISEMIVEI